MAMAHQRTPRSHVKSYLIALPLMRLQADIWSDVESETSSDAANDSAAKTLRQLVGDEETRDSITTPSDGVSPPTPLATRKRKRSFLRLQSLDSDAGTDETQVQLSWEIAELSIRPWGDKSFRGVRPPDFIYPKSSYDGWIPPFAETSEVDALRELVSLDCRRCLSLNRMLTVRDSAGTFKRFPRFISGVCASGAKASSAIGQRRLSVHRARSVQHLQARSRPSSQ